MAQRDGCFVLIRTQKNRPLVFGEFASKGWQYRTAYFRDFDGKYYQVSISVAQGSDGNVVYNIGEIQERSFPNTTELTARGSSAKGGAQGVREISSENSLPQ